MTLPLGIRTYGVQAAARQPLVTFMVDSLKAAGCRIIHEPDPSSAPFVITFETQAGERMGVVAYAFLATRTPTKNRPDDERSFQIKYGPDDKSLHELWQDPLGIYTTLLIGIDPEEGFFVAADPEVHNPTRFFIRLEFKDRHAEAIKKEGWHAWERQSRGPRHLLLTERLFEHETLVGGTSEAFLDLIRFERMAVGLSPGDRHLLADKYAPAAAAVAATHPLVSEFELEPDQILELIAGARRLKMAVRGWVAEEKLRETLANTPGVTHCERLDEEGGPDLRVRWHDGPPLTVECKNVLRKPTAAGLPRIDFQRTRASKQDPCSRYYAADDFDVVAGCLHAVTESWEFRYILPASLNPRVGCPGKLDNKVLIDGMWLTDAGSAFEQAYAGLP
ncbi:hypothetical protein [uncultured Sphingomonas sp.]|uniref:hypothetical protein n=1 Tax=uncultured Sphingomonas sp. TaxID=158754 RepID=UPI0025F2FF33|nr:hypothetical protein [uncultured Sphingomonas sp.]